MHRNAFITECKNFDLSKVFLMKILLIEPVVNPGQSDPTEKEL
jgi:hypothetical protein